MGYNTKYRLWHDAKDKKTLNAIQKALRIKGIKDNWLDPIKDESQKWYYDPDGLTMKWYEHEDDMRDIAKQFPTVLFELTGDGEEWNDKWKLYLKGKETQVSRARITVEYDPCTL